MYYGLVQKGNAMYYLKSEQSFDSAHFLSDYQGKCRNIHGHRWRVVIEIKSPVLQSQGPYKGMAVDFSKLKQDIKEETGYFDHALILEAGTLKKEVLNGLTEGNFRYVEVEFTPTAEEFSKYFYYKIKEKGYEVVRAWVYETPHNCASYGEDSCGTV